MIDFTMKHPRATIEHLGFIPMFFDEHDPAPAREQIDDRYRHGGGWRVHKGWTMSEEGIFFPGDPIMPVIAEAKLRDETIRVYDMAWVAIIQPDGTFEVARID